MFFFFGQPTINEGGAVATRCTSPLLSMVDSLPLQQTLDQGNIFKLQALDIPSVLLGTPEASPAVLRGRQFWKYSGGFKCLEL